MSSRTISSEAPRVFPHTRWSVVLAATQQDAAESAAALESTCRAYWYPLHAHVRRCGQSAHDAQNLTQKFFRCLLERRWLDSADPAKGKRRTSLVVMLKNFMNKERWRAFAQRRGGGTARAQFDTTFAENVYAADTRSLAPEDTVDRQWALTLLNLTTKRLSAEFAAAAMRISRSTRRWPTFPNS